jgi:hypothetical protein
MPQINLGDDGIARIVPEPHPDIRKYQGVEVEFRDLLAWWDYDDSFESWLKRKMFPDDEDLYERAVIQEWALMGVPRPNVVAIDVTVLFEDD